MLGAPIGGRHRSGTHAATMRTASGYDVAGVASDTLRQLTGGFLLYARLDSVLASFLGQCQALRYFRRVAFGFVLHYIFFFGFGRGEFRDHPVDLLFEKTMVARGN